MNWMPGSIDSAQSAAVTHDGKRSNHCLWTRVRLDFKVED